MEVWCEYSRQMRALYARVWTSRKLRLMGWDPESPRRLPHGCKLPVARGGRVYFAGYEGWARECQPFDMSRLQTGAWACKSSWCEEQDFVVRCALVLLAELGGASRLLGPGPLAPWWDAIEWLTQQPGLPNSYGRAASVLLQTADEWSDDDAERAERPVQAAIAVWARADPRRDPCGRAARLTQRPKSNCASSIGSAVP